MKRERITVLEDEIDDYTSEDSWDIKDETYNFVETFRTDGDGEWYAVIVQRESDGKYFEFSWGYGDTRNYYEDEWLEVKRKTVTKNTWYWGDEDED